MIWAKEETLPREEIERIQLTKLKDTVRYIYDRVKPYREKMDMAGVRPEDIQTLEDLKKLPFTYKADFRDHYPDGLFAVDKKEIVRYHASSGTTGKPTVVGYTRNDLDIWLNNVARIACMGGATEEDVAQIAFGYGTFTGALGLHGGLEKIGASVIPMSSGNTNKQIMFLQDMGVTLLVANPVLCAPSWRGTSQKRDRSIKRFKDKNRTVRRRRHDRADAGRDAPCLGRTVCLYTKLWYE